MPGLYDLTPEEVAAENYGNPNMPGGVMAGMEDPYMDQGIAGIGQAGGGQEGLAKLLAMAMRSGNQFDPKIMTPENAELYSRLGIMPEQSVLREDEREYAQALRDSPMPEGRQGREFYTAASPLEFAAKLGQTYVGASREKELLAQQREALQQQKAIRAQYMAALGQQNGAPQGMQPQPMGNSVPGTQLMGGRNMISNILRGANF